ncbi:conserved repeat protein [Leptolyngbya sp. Heron Island J]|nr:conserved repeat protein [Leptolyngbya sp. Heron Island J]
MQIPFLSLNSLGIHHRFTKKENSFPNSRKGYYFLSSRNYLLATLGLASMMGGIFATTATAEVTTFGVSVRSDGTANFSGPDPTYPGFSNAGNDANDENGIVRTYDTVTYRVNYATDTQPNGSTTITVTIGDDYHLWEENQSSCLGSVSVSSDRKTLTCTETLPTSTTGFFDFTAAVLGTAPHGADLAVNANLTSSAGSLSTGPTQVKVSATPRMDLALDDYGPPRQIGLVNGPTGEEGLVYAWPLAIVAPKGSEILGDADPSTPGNQIIITNVVSSISSNARLYDWGGRLGCEPNTTDNGINGAWAKEMPLGSLTIAGAGQEANAVADSGTWNCNQSGGAGTDITITITDADLSGQHRPILDANGGTLNANETHLVAGIIQIWIPTSDFPTGQNRLTVTNYYDFLDTPSINNQPNVEPDQGGHVTVPISDSDNVNNDRTFSLQRPLGSLSQDKYYRTPYSGGNFNNNSVLYPMTDIETGDGVVLPGQVFGSYFTSNNNGVGDLTNVILCDKFDNRTQILAPNPTSGEYVELRTNGDRLNESEVIIEYGVGGDTATDSYYGAETAALDDVTRFLAQHDATCDDSDAIWYSETDLANNPSLIPQVTRVRVQPTSGVLPEGFRIDAVLHLQALNIDPVTGVQIPDPTILANLVTSRSDETNSGGWNLGSYNPVDHSGNDDGDRLRLTRAVVRIDKSTDDPTNGTEADDSVNTVRATENITFALEPTLTALINDVSTAEIVVTDTLPTELRYITGSANIPPDSVIENGDGTMTLSWNLGDYAPNVPIPTITFEAKAGFDIVGGTSIANQASIAALDDTGSDLDSSPLESRTDIRSVTIINNAAFTIFKEAVTPEIEPGEDIVYDLYLANLSEDIDVTAGSEFIDILPYEGDGSIRDAFDGVGTPPTDYTATPIFKTIQDVDNVGFTFQFTHDSPNNISDNPATQNSSTIWCTPAEVTSGAADCPAIDYSDVTAVLITAPAMNAGEPTRRLRLTMSSTGSLGSDVYTNNFKGTPNHPSLGFIPSVDATVRTRASTFASLGGQVWDDTNFNGIQDDGESGYDNVVVHLITPDDGTIQATQTISSGGFYNFIDLAPNDYRVQVELPNSYRFTRRNRGNDDELDSDVNPVTGKTARITLTAGNNIDNLDAGILLDTDDDAIPDVIDGTGDRDGDGVPNYQDADPAGYFYDEATGEMIPGGQISVSGPGAINLTHDGSATGFYEWFIDGTAGTYTMAVTPPPGYELSNTCLKQDPPPFDPTGGVDPTVLGNYEDTGSAGFLTGNNCTIFYLSFNLDAGDPFVINNNIPLKQSSTTTSGSTFACNTSAYSIINSPSEFGIFDPTTLSFNSINTATAPNFDPPIEVNGLAYNILDNYLYGVVVNPLGESSFQWREIVRISADGTLEGLGRATLVSNPSVELNTPAWWNGTMDGRGRYYNMADGNTLRIVNIGNAPANGTLTYDTVAITGLPDFPADLNFNPVDGQLYAIKDGNLYRIPPTGGAATVVTTTGDPLPFNSGGSWATSSGISYFYKNVAGGDNALFAIDLTQSPAVVHRVGPVVINDKFDATSCTPPAITKNVEPEIAFPGDTVTYTYVLYNGHGTDIFIDFEDVLTDPNITFDTNSLSVASPGDGTVTTFNDTELSISSINIPNGVDNITNSVTFTVNAVVDNNAPVGNIDNQASLSFGAQTFPSDDPDSPPIDDPTTFTVVSSDPDVLLVKRITAINGDRTKNPNDNTTLNGIVNDNVTNSADDMSNWPNGYLLGELDAGLVNPGDEIEYTVYFLNAGGTTAETVRICDWIQPNQSFVTGLYGGNDIELVIGSTTYNLTDDSDATTVDRGEVTTVGNLPAVPTCNLSGFSTSATDEVVVVDITGTTGDPTGLATLPNTTGQGTPTNAYGYFRFTTKVNE